MKVIIRIIALPFWAAIILIQLVKLFFVYCINFLRFGGEAIMYTHKNQRKTIADIYDKLEKE